MLPSPWKACSRIPRQSGRGSGWLQGLPATLMLRRYRCPVGTLSIIRWAFISVAPADFSDSFHIVLCTHLAGVAPAGSTLPMIWKQAERLLQMWQRWPLCPKVSSEPASSVCSTIGELQASQADRDQEEGASQPI